MDSVLKASQMRLTNYMRDAFVAAVMNDVPNAERVELEAKVHKIALDDALKTCPAPIKAAWADNLLRPFVRTRTVSFYSINYGRPFRQIEVPCASDYSQSPSTKERIEAFAKVASQANKTREELETKLRAVAYGVTTRKALVEALPEFEKYLPADDAKAVRSLPVVANVVSEFVKAGWPKGGKKGGAK